MYLFCNSSHTNDSHTTGVSSFRSRKVSPSAIEPAGQEEQSDSIDVEKNESSSLSGSSSETIPLPSSPMPDSPLQANVKQRVAQFEMILEKEIRKEKGTHFGSFYLVRMILFN
jgi:hypothetical protein